MLSYAPTNRAKSTLLWRIMLPIVITQMGLFGMSVLDTMMSGWAGTNDLAGVAIGTSVWFPAFLLLSGVLMALTPMVAQQKGAGVDVFTIRTWVQHTLLIAVLLSACCIGIGTILVPMLLASLHLSAPVAYVAMHYMIGLSLGVVPLFIAYTLRIFFEALGLTMLSTIPVLIALPINFVLNGMLILGWWGMPRLGGIGAGYASALTYVCMCIVCIVISHRHPLLRHYTLWRGWSVPKWHMVRRLLRVGVPMGLSTFVEASIFSVVTVLVGAQFTPSAIAATQIAISFAGALFMIPLSIAMALTILIAYERGAGRTRDARQYAAIGVGWASIFALTNALLVLFFRTPIAQLYTSDPAVLELTVQLLLLVVVFQIADALQSTLQGILRAYEDTTMPFVVTVIAYWICGIPLGTVLASDWGGQLGPLGYWIGITVGLFGAAIGFALRVSSVHRR
jgi:MATE family multidrug resistance protein